MTDGQTHHDECWRYHPACAMEMAERLHGQVEAFKRDRTIAVLGEDIYRLTKERDEARAEVERLREAIALVEPDPGLSHVSRQVLRAALRGEEE